MARTEAQTWHLRGKWQNQGWPTGDHWRLLHKQSICSTRVAPQWPWLAKPSAPSFLANFHIIELTERWALKPTSASEDRSLRLFTLNIKTIPKTCLYTEVSEVNPAGKASPRTPTSSAASTSLSQFLMDARHAALRTQLLVSGDTRMFPPTTQGHFFKSQDFFRHKKIPREPLILKSLCWMTFFGYLITNHIFPLTDSSVKQLSEGRVIVRGYNMTKFIIISSGLRSWYYSHETAFHFRVTSLHMDLIHEITFPLLYHTITGGTYESNSWLKS